MSPSSQPTLRRAMTLCVASLVLLVGALSSAQTKPNLKQPAVKVTKLKNAPVSKKVTKMALTTPASKQAKATKAKAKAAKKAKQDFLWDGEELYYTVEIAGVEAAHASVRIGKRTKKKGVTYIPMASDAVSIAAAEKVYKVNNRADTFIDLGTFQPLKSDKTIREDGNQRIYKVRYKPGKFTAQVDKDIQNKDKQRKQRKYDRAVPGDIHDGLTWLFDLRSQPLKPGDTYTYYIYDGWKLSRLKATVVGDKKAWTPLEEYDTIQVDIEREILRSRWTKTKNTKRGEPKLTRRDKPYYFASVYLTKDDLHVPVKIFVTSSKADAELKLTKYKAPLTR